MNRLNLYTLVHIILTRTVNGIPRKRSSISPIGFRLCRCSGRFADDLALHLRDPYPTKEQLITFRMDAMKRLLIVVYTWREDRIQLISPHRATHHERINNVR